MTGRMEIDDCDACGRTRRRVEVTARDGVELRICVKWRECNAAQPSLDVMSGRAS